MAAAKLEVVLTPGVNKKNLLEFHLYKCISTLLNVSYTTAPVELKMVVKTGSTYNFGYIGYIIDRNAVSNANVMFSRVANSMKRRSTPTISCF
jgi:hypothetical protein